MHFVPGTNYLVHSPVFNVLVYEHHVMKKEETDKIDYSITTTEEPVLGVHLKQLEGGSTLEALDPGLTGVVIISLPLLPS